MGPPGPSEALDIVHPLVTPLLTSPACVDLSRAVAPIGPGGGGGGGCVCRVPNMFHQREREMFYLMTHLTHFIYGSMASDMVKDHSDSEKGNPLPPHRLLLSINSKGSFICIIPQTG